MSATDVYEASPVKRGSTRAEVERRRESLFESAIDDHLPHHQFEVLRAAEETERTLLQQLVDGLAT